MIFFHLYKIFQKESQNSLEGISPHKWLESAVVGNPAFFFFFFSPVLVCEHISILCLYVGPRPSEQVNLSVPTRVKQEYWRDQDKLSGASLDKATVL